MSCETGAVAKPRVEGGALIATAFCCCEELELGGRVACNRGL